MELVRGGGVCLWSTPFVICSSWLDRAHYTPTCVLIFFPIHPTSLHCIAVVFCWRSISKPS
jgi:hypothetical protein